jgi:prophage antirepressor-like protein
MNDSYQNPETHIALFQRKEVRRTIHNNEWWFVITDVIAALTDSADPSQYLKRIRQRDPQLNKAFKGGVQFVPPLALEFATAGGPQGVLCWNTEGIFRLIQSIPSPKAEPFKRWLAKVGYERIQEIEDPELATKRTRAIYKAKGYSQNKQAARAGGTVAGNARRELETKSGRKVVTSENYLALAQSTKKAQRLTGNPGGKTK